MNIKRAKQEITNSLAAYLSKDAFGDYRIPSIRQRPILLIGPPGIGKTQIMRQIADEQGIGLVSYTLTHHTRQSALGLPYLSRESFDGQEYEVTAYTMSEIIASVYREIEQNGKREGILFLDEINCISETLAPMMLQFLQCKTFGNQPLPQGWLVVAAGNPPEYNKSVREFDLVTLDRVRMIEVSEDYAAWKEYASRKAIHGAILSYLELRREHFYKVSQGADGAELVTARGWEDLSELMLSYEQLALPIDRQVIAQYLQLPEVATDFANYLMLYEKYRALYRVDDILQGEYDGLRIEELKNAGFDEKLGVIGLLLSALSRSAQGLFEQEQLCDALHEDLQAVRDGKTDLATLCRQGEDSLARCRAQHDSDRAQKRLLAARVSCLRSFFAQVQREKAAGEAVMAAVQPLFAAEVDKRAQMIAQTEQALHHAFVFLGEALGDSHELVLFATELTAGYYTSWFVQSFGSEDYFAQSERLQFDDRAREIRDKIAALRGAKKS